MASVREQERAHEIGEVLPAGQNLVEEHKEGRGEIELAPETNGERVVVRQWLAIIRGV